MRIINTKKSILLNSDSTTFLIELASHEINVELYKSLWLQLAMYKSHKYFLQHERAYPGQNQKLEPTQFKAQFNTPASNFLCSRNVISKRNLSEISHFWVISRKQFFEISNHIKIEHSMKKMLLTYFYDRFSYLSCQF